MRAREFMIEAERKPASTPKIELHPRIANLTIRDVPKPFINAFYERGITNPNTIIAYYTVSGKETKAMVGSENLN
jgi:hypothetical protein